MSDQENGQGAAADDAEARAGGETAKEQSHEALLLSLQDAQTKADEHWNELLRARAELTNLQRRHNGLLGIRPSQVANIHCFSYSTIMAVGAHLRDKKLQIKAKQVYRLRHTRPSTTA